jgi:serine protease AprX
MHTIASRSFLRGIIFCIALIIIAGVFCFGQTKKVVFLKDKNLSPFSLSDPAIYLSEKAIARRARYKIPIDSTDLPVNPQYILEIGKLNNVRILGSSKWLNALIIECNDSISLTRLNSLPYVQSTADIALRTTQSSHRKWHNENSSRSTKRLSNNSSRVASAMNYGASAEQISIHNGQLLHLLGAKGEGMMIAFMDAGYNEYDKNRFLKSVIEENRIVSARDFYTLDNDVNDNNHGLLCLSAVAASIPGEYIGSCPNANYLLLRTEDATSEQIIEEYMWGIGAEYADSCGADVLSSSVGYTTFDNPLQNHKYEELDGNTTIVTRMADLAAKKGILVVTSAGNEGLSSWKYIGAPADGDSVFTIGAIDLNKQIAGFSSFGPSSAGSIKPDIVSIGLSTALIGTNQSVIYSSGTSFSTPNIAGLITCLWQLFPDLNNQQIMEFIRKSADRYTNPDERYGYGIPDMVKAMELILQTKVRSSINRTVCKATLSWKSYDRKGMGYIIQRKDEWLSDYYTLDTIYSTGSAWSNNAYTFTDERILGSTKYRILQVVPLDGSNAFVFTLDSLSAEAPSETCIINTITIFPNPAKHQLNIQLPYTQDNTQYLIHFFDVQGKKVKTVKWEKMQGGNQIFSIPLAGMAKGVYIVEILLQNKRFHSGKIIID